MAKVETGAGSAIDMLATQAETWAIEDVKPNPRNVRKHSYEQVKRIANSIKRFGFTIPLLVDEDGVLIAGHGRLEAAKELQLETVPVIVAAGWSDEQKRAYAIADNRLAELSEWDLNALSVELSEIISDDVFDLSEIGFTPSDLEAIGDGTFAPVLFPTADTSEVTEKDVEKAEKEHAERGKKAAEQKLVKVMCPHCAEEFYVDEASIVR